MDSERFARLIHGMAYASTALASQIPNSRHSSADRAYSYWNNEEKESSLGIAYAILELANLKRRLVLTFLDFS